MLHVNYSYIKIILSAFVSETCGLYNMKYATVLRIEPQTLA
jgi:hypothetical protein